MFKNQSSSQSRHQLIAVNLPPESSTSLPPAPPSPSVAPHTVRSVGGLFESDPKPVWLAAYGGLRWMQSTINN